MIRDITQGAFTLLSDEILSFVPFVRIDDHQVTMTLGNPGHRYTIPYSARDQRPLIVFDGDIPQDGLAKASKQVHAEALHRLHQPGAHTRKRKEHEIEIPLPTTLYRRFIILPQGRGVIVRYRKRSAAHRYTIVDAHHYHNSHWHVDVSSCTY